MRALAVSAIVAACGDPQFGVVGLCGTDAAIDASLDAPMDAWICPTSPPTTFVDPTGQGHIDVAIQKPDTYSCVGPTLPLLVFLHPYGASTGDEIQTRLGFRYVKSQALVLSPTGLLEPGTAAHYWNADPSGGDRAGVGNDDVAYLRAMIEWGAANYNVDRSRVVVAGVSNGGFMAERLRCEVSDLVTHVLDSSGAGQSVGMTCPAYARPVHAIVDHAESDPSVLYGGGRLSGMSVDYVSTLTTVAQNATQSGCSDLHVEQLAAYDHDYNVEGSDTDRLTHTTCSGAIVEHWRRPTGGHTYTATLVDGCTSTKCPVPLQTRLSVDVWDFVQAHPRGQ